MFQTTYTDTDTHTRTHTRTHTCTHAYKCTCVSLFFFLLFGAVGGGVGWVEWSGVCRGVVWCGVSGAKVTEQIV